MVTFHYHLPLYLTSLCYKGPLIEPITNHVRTSLTTATIRQVKCGNFPDDSHVTIAYYNGEDCLGEFESTEGHRLTKLKKTTKEVKVSAIDHLGNIAQTTFCIGQTIPSVSYEDICRTPNAILIKGLKLTNFPKTNKIVACTSDGQADISYTFEENGVNGTTPNQLELLGYGQTWRGGVVMVTATDANKEYQAECEIFIKGPGNVL